MEEKVNHYIDQKLDSISYARANYIKCGSFQIDGFGGNVVVGKVRKNKENVDVIILAEEELHGKYGDNICGVYCILQKGILIINDLNKPIGRKNRRIFLESIKNSLPNIKIKKLK